MNKGSNEKSRKKSHLFERAAINFLFIMAFMFVVVVNTISIMQIKDFDAANKWLIHTYQVIRANNNILTGVLGAESVVRGYLITDDPQFLQGLKAKIDCVNDNYELAKKLTQDNPSQQAKLVALKPILDQRMNDLHEFLQQTPKVIEDHKKVEVVKSAQQVSDQIQKVLSEVNETEFALLKERNHEVVHYFGKISMLTIFSGTVSMLLLVMGLIIVNFQQTRQIKAEENTKKADEILKGIINGTSDFIAAIDKNFNLIAFNQGYESEFKRIYGKRISLGINMKDLLGSLPDEKNKLIKNWERALNGEEFTEIIEAGDKRLAIEQYEISYYGLYNQEGDLIGASEIIRNIKKRIEEEKAKQIASERLELAFKELKQHTQEVSLINEMDNVLQTCVTIDETLVIIKNYSRKLFPNTAGILYLMDSSKKFLEAKTEWNSPALKEKVFSPDQCWGLRQLKVYVFKNTGESILCKHNAEDDDLHSYICAPLLSSNEVIGLLYIEIKDLDPKEERKSPDIQKYELIVNNVSSQLALALANIKLRDTLKTRSLHDPLTGLYNRYYLEDSLEKDLIRAKQKDTSLALVMMDIDHFKHINDKYGHEAGDIVLVEVSKIIQDATAKGDVVCRYGGEEFLFILYDAKLEQVYDHIEKIRKKIADTKYILNGIEIGPITVSFGIALYPDHAMNNTELIGAADFALYESKRNGRNTVTVYSS